MYSKKLFLILFLALFAPNWAQENKIELQNSILLDPLIGKQQLLGPDLADLNGDSQLELIVGNYAGNIFSIKNASTVENPLFKNEQAITADSQPIKLNHW